MFEAKEMRVRDFPSGGEKRFGNECFSPDDKVTVELCPDGTLQFAVLFPAQMLFGVYLLDKNPQDWIKLGEDSGVELTSLNQEASSDLTP